MQSGSVLKLHVKSDDNCLKIIEKLAPAERPLDILAHDAGKLRSAGEICHL
jgi:hypothetical protein